MSSELDAEQIFKHVLDQTNPSFPAIKILELGAASGSRASLDWQQAIKRAYDPSTKTLRTVEP